MLFYKLYKNDQGRTVGFLQGNEACVEAAILGGVRFYAGYPITPSSEIAAVSAEKLPMYGGRFIQMEDEIASMAAIIGASMTGAKVMTATSGPGFSLKQENLGYAIINEVPCIVVNVQRGGPSTGLPTQIAHGDIMQARWGTHGDHPIIVLAPASVNEIFHLTLKAIDFSEKYRNPVILLLDETLAHMREKVVFPLEKELALAQRPKTTVSAKEFKPFDSSFGDVPPFAAFGSGYQYNITGLIHDESGFPTTVPGEVKALLERIHRKINDHLDDILMVKEFMTEDADILLISFGATTKSCISAMEAGRKQGLKIGVLQIITVWPFPDQIVKEITTKIPRVFVVEMNMGQIILEVQRTADKAAKVQGINKYDGFLINPQQILAMLRDKMDQ